MKLLIIIKDFETYNINDECKELTLRKSNLIDLKNASSNINNINDNKFGGNIEHKSILDALPRFIK